VVDDDAVFDRPRARLGDRVPADGEPVTPDWTDLDLVVADRKWRVVAAADRRGDVDPRRARYVDGLEVQAVDAGPSDSAAVCRDVISDVARQRSDVGLLPQTSVCVLITIPVT
jgi:hypothetical protein